MREKVRNAVFYLIVLHNAHTLRNNWKILNLVPIRHEKVSIKAFGTTCSKIQGIENLKFEVKGMNKNIFVEALVIPTICSTLTNQGSNSSLRNLSLAQNSMESSLNIDVLIGLDNYYNFIYGTVIRGKFNDPIALESTLGHDYKWSL